MEKILEQRGITPEMASRLGWRSFDEWLEMPVIRGGVEVGYKRRTFCKEKKFMQKKGTPQVLYNIDCIAEIGEADLIVTEGEMDCAVALQCGYNAVSVPNGAPLESIDGDVSKYKYLDDLPKDNVLLLAFDDDAQGHNLLHDVAKRVGRARCKWVKYPQGCKDLNEVLLKYGTKGVSESIKRANWMEVKDVSRMADLPPPPEFETIDCPVDGMADLYKLRLGDFTVVTGIPSMGKTTFANEVAAQMAIRHNWNVCVASFEQNPRADFEPWLKSHYHGKPVNLQTREQIKEAADWIHKRFIFIVPTQDHDEDLDLKYLIDRIEVAVYRYDSKLVIVDPWNELDHTRPHGMSQTEYTGFAIKKLKALAGRLQIHLMVITHPAKMMRDKNGEYPVPSLYDIADSAHWRNKADMGIIVHRDDEVSSRIIVAKCRYHGKIGNVGEAKVAYDSYLHRFCKSAI